VSEWRCGAETAEQESGCAPATRTAAPSMRRPPCVAVQGGGRGTDYPRHAVGHLSHWESNRDADAISAHETLRSSQMMYVSSSELAQCITPRHASSAPKRLLRIQYRVCLPS
jgi:hypothetical protein